MRIFHAFAIALAVASVLVLAGCNPRQEPDPDVTAEPIGDGLGFSYSHPLLTRYAPDDPNVAPFVVTADKATSAATGGETDGGAKENVGVPEYTVLDEKVHDAPIKTQVQLDILVTGEITETGLRRLLGDLYANRAGRTGFRHHAKPTHIFISAYTDRDSATSGMGQWIAMLSKVGESGQPEIRVNNRQLAGMKTASEVRFGLTEQKRISIWQEYVVDVEDRANREAKETFPLEPEKSMKPGSQFTLIKETPLMAELESADAIESIGKIRRLPAGTLIRVKRVAKKNFTPWYEVDVMTGDGTPSASGWINSIALTGQAQEDMKAQLQKQGTLQSQLQAKYEGEFFKKHSLSEEQWKAIITEAHEKDWPFPTRDSTNEATR